MFLVAGLNKVKEISRKAIRIIKPLEDLTIIKKFRLDTTATKVATVNHTFVVEIYLKADTLRNPKR